MFIGGFSRPRFFPITEIVVGLLFILFKFIISDIDTIQAYGDMPAVFLIMFLPGIILIGQGILLKLTERKTSKAGS
jgi:hypothetical protein